MINSIEFVQEVYPFPNNTCIHFNDGLNMICGDQGTGKSTLLEAIMMHDREFVNHIKLSQDHKYKAFAYFNPEVHNPRTIGGSTMPIGETRYSATLEMFYERIRQKLANSRLTNAHHFQVMIAEAFAACKNSSMNVIDKKLIDLDVIAKSSMQSHGQSLFPFLEAALDVDDGIIFLDEPETSLSIASQLKLSGMLNKASRTNQIFVATHSEILINRRAGNEMVLSLDEPKPTWVHKTTFIENQYANR